VLRLLQTRGGATVAELATELGLGQASVRRHLDHLRMEGMVDVRADKHGVGRPAFVFYPTAEAEDRQPAGYARLLARLYQGLHALDASKVQGSDGAGVLRSAFEAAAEEAVGQRRAMVAASSLEGRIAQATEALQPEGIVDEWNQQDDGYHLKNSACPYRQSALSSVAPCEFDRRTIELLVDAPVRQVRRIADGELQCEYVVAAAAEKAAESRQEQA
jgi:predicted ArsR family transcriptional regulator